MMKLKLVNVVNVFLATSGLLAPAQAAFSHTVLQQKHAEEIHLVCVKQAEHLLCDPEKSGERNSSSAPNQGTANSAKATQNQKSSTVTVVPPLLSSAQQKSIANILLGFIYFVLPCGLGLGLFLHNKYSVYRATLLKEQIELLDKLWQDNTDTRRKANEQIELLERLWQYDLDNDATTDTGREAKG